MQCQRQIGLKRDPGMGSKPGLVVEVNGDSPQYSIFLGSDFTGAYELEYQYVHINKALT